jgi:ribonuclease HI
MTRERASVEGSVAFLLSYAESLDLISHQVAFDDNGKGKGKIGLANPALDGNSNRTVKAAQWNPPPHGWIKVNSDAGFCKDTGTAGCGVVARNEDGEVILTAWHCGSPEQAEACLDAVRLASEWIRQPICLESDCSVIVNAIKMNDSSRACWAGTTAGLWRSADYCLIARSPIRDDREGNRVQANALCYASICRRRLVL